MNKLDISNWKYFSLGDEKYFKVKLVRKRIILSDYKFSWTKSHDSVPIISSSEFTNGVMGFVSKNNKDNLYLSHTITISGYGSVGACFFQPFNFYANNSILTIRLVEKNINHLLAFFLCSIISLEKFRYSFGRALNLENLLKVKIKLPINEKEEPDWLWMENYSRKIFEKVKKDIIKLADIYRESNNCIPNTPKWEEINISDYFYVKSTKTTKKEGILPGEFAYISNKNTSNGYECSSHLSTEEGNVISVSDFGAGAFYQEDRFSCTYHVEKIYPKDKELNKYTALFLTTLLNLGAYKYSYGRIRNLRELKKEKIILPIDKNKEIDWKYMENEMKTLQKRIIDNFKLKLVKIHYKEI